MQQPIMIGPSRDNSKMELAKLLMRPQPRTGHFSDGIADAGRSIAAAYLTKQQRAEDKEFLSQHAQQMGDILQSLGGGAPSLPQSAVQAATAPTSLLGGFKGNADTNAGTVGAKDPGETGQPVMLGDDDSPVVSPSDRKNPEKRSLRGIIEDAYEDATAPETTSAGRKLYQDADGTPYSEKSITVTDPAINNGQPTNIPSVFGGQELPQAEAIRRIVEAGGVDPETGRELPAFASIEEAVAAAQARSDSLGADLSQKSLYQPASLASRPAQAPVVPAGAPGQPGAGSNPLSGIPGAPGGDQALVDAMLGARQQQTGQTPPAAPWQQAAGGNPYAGLLSALQGVDPSLALPIYQQAIGAHVNRMLAGPGAAQSDIGQIMADVQAGLITQEQANAQLAKLAYIKPDDGYTLGTGQFRFDNAGNVVAQGPAKTATPPAPTQLAKLITERDRLPEGHPMRATYDEAIKTAAEGVKNLSVGSIPPGYVLHENPETGGYSMQLVPGSPQAREIEAQAEKADLGQAAKVQTANVVVTDIDRILEMTDDSWFPTTGFGGAVASFVPGTAAHNVSKLLESIEANLAFDSLQAMRDASPTGGALGNVTEKELSLLKSRLGSVAQSLTADEFRKNLQRVKDTYRDIIHGPGNWQGEGELTVSGPFQLDDAGLESLGISVGGQLVPSGLLRQQAQAQNVPVEQIATEMLAGQFGLDMIGEDLVIGNQVFDLEMLLETERQTGDPVPVILENLLRMNAERNEQPRDFRR